MDCRDAECAFLGGQVESLEEQMNDNLMRQFQPMFSEDRGVKKRVSANDRDNLINSVSDFSATGDGVQSRAQLFQQAKETLMAQRQGGAAMTGASKTATGFH